MGIFASKIIAVIMSAILVGAGADKEITEQAAINASSDIDIVALLALDVDDFPFPSCLREYVDGPYSTAPGDATYTGLIVVAQGLGFVRSMSPQVIDEAGHIIYGQVHCSAEVVRDPGIAGYASSLEEAMQSKRAGARPLVVNGNSVEGAFPCHIVVSKNDAKRILMGNVLYNYLGHLKVVIVDN